MTICTQKYGKVVILHQSIAIAALPLTHYLELSLTSIHTAQEQQVTLH